MDAARGKRKCDDPVDRRTTAGLEGHKRSKVAAIQDSHFSREHAASSLPSPERSAEDVSFFDEAFFAFTTEFSDQAALEQLLSPESQNAIVTPISPDAAVENFEHLFEVPLDENSDRLSEVTPVENFDRLSEVPPVENFDHLFEVPPVGNFDHLVEVPPVENLDHPFKVPPVGNFDHLFEAPFDSAHDSIFSLFNDTAGDDTLESIGNYIHTDETSPIVSPPTQVAQSVHDNLFTANPNDIPSFDDWIAEGVQHREDHSITNPDDAAPNPKTNCTSSVVSGSVKGSLMVPSLSHTPVAEFQTLPTLPPNGMQQTLPILGNGDAFRQTQVAQPVHQLLQQRPVQSQAQYQWLQSKNSRNTSLEFQKYSTGSHHSLPTQRPGSNHSTPQTPEARHSFQRHSQTTQQSPQYVPLSPEQMSAAFDQWLKEEFRKAHKGRSAGDIQQLYNWGHIALMPEFTRKYGRKPNPPELQHFFIQRKVIHGMWLEDQNRAQYNLVLQQQTPTPAQRHQVAVTGQQQANVCLNGWERDTRNPIGCGSRRRLAPLGCQFGWQ